MGKPVVALAGTSWKNTTNGSINSEESRRSQRNKDLEEIRRNALAAKRKLRSRIVQKNKTKLEKVLGQFASRRREFEDAVQIPLLLNRSGSEGDQRQRSHHLFDRDENSSEKQTSNVENSKVTSNIKRQKPINLKGFFRAGIKGKQLTRPLTSTERLKQAVLNNDALQIFQSGNFIRPIPSKLPEISPLTKMEISKALNEFTDSSDTDDLTSVENKKFSPIFKRYKRKAAVVKSDNNKVLNDIPSQKNQFLITKYITKEDNCKRYLFKEENTVINNENSKYNNSNNSNNSQYENNDPIRCFQRNLTPENVIFFGEYKPANDVNNTSEKKNHKICPTDPKLTEYYIQFFKKIARKDSKNFVKNILEGPVKNATAALRTTYANTFKGYLYRQKLERNKYRSQSVNDLDTESSNSEIMVEPDSAISRKLKKNNVQLVQNTQMIKWGSDSNSNASINNNAVEKDFYDDIEIAQNQFSMRVYTSSSKSGHSDLEAPSSVKVNVDRGSEKMIKKMDFIHPDRQELTARYLNDINVNNANYQRDIEEKLSYHHEKKLLHTNNNNGMKVCIASKSTKHVPAILRKNRSLGDCTSNEVLFSIDKELEYTEASKRTSMHDSGTNLISERTPNCSNPTSSQAAEAPKCKYVYMNAKYNQPPRITAPGQVRKLQKNASFQKMHLFPTSHEARQNYILSQNSEASSIEKQVSFADGSNDFSMFQLSQGTSREIQDRTNRLTLQSSQNYSQDSVNQMLAAASNHYSSYQNTYFKTCDPPSNHAPYKPQQVAQCRGPSINAYDIALDPNAIAYNDYRHTQSLKNGSFQGCILNECQMCKDHQPQSSWQRQDPMIVYMQKQNEQHPVKFIAIGDDRMPQRRPIYGIEDANICSHALKPSASTQQYNQVVNPRYQQVAVEQACYALSSIPCHSRELVKCDNVQRESNFTSNDFPESGRKAMNFVPNSMSDQNFHAQRNIPMCRDVHNQRYVEPVQVQMQSSTYVSPGVYQHYNHPSNTMIFKVNDVYLEKVNHNVHHQQRP